MTFSSSMKLVTATISISGALGLDLRDRAHAVDVGHQQVHQDHVGVEPRPGDALAAVAASPTTSMSSEQVEEAAQPAPDDGVVVHEEHADGRASSTGRLRDTAAARPGQSCAGRDRV